MASGISPVILLPVKRLLPFRGLHRVAGDTINGTGEDFLFRQNDSAKGSAQNDSPVSSLEGYDRRNFPIGIEAYCNRGGGL